MIIEDYCYYKETSGMIAASQKLCEMFLLDHTVTKESGAHDHDDEDNDNEGRLIPSRLKCLITIEWIPVKSII